MPISSPPTADFLYVGRERLRASLNFRFHIRRVLSSSSSCADKTSTAQVPQKQTIMVAAISRQFSATIFRQVIYLSPQEKFVLLIHDLAKRYTHTSYID